MRIAARPATRAAPERRKASQGSSSWREPLPPRRGRRCRGGLRPSSLRQISRGHLRWLIAPSLEGNGGDEMDQCSRHDTPPAISVNLTDWLGHDLGRVRSGSLASHLGRVASAVARVSSNFGRSSLCGLVPLPRSLVSSPTTLVRVNSVNRSPYEYRLCRQGEPLGQSTPVREGTTEIRRVVPASACSSCEK